MVLVNCTDAHSSVISYKVFRPDRQNMQEENKDKIKTAVALSYEKGEEAPKIVAMGKGERAEKLLEIAKDSDVPIHEDAALANTLSKMNIGDFIPQELYGVVAEILVMVDRAEAKKKAMISG